MATIDYSKPIEIADNIFWVGNILKNDPFQCHVYLIKNGKESILIDPGSKLTWPETKKKIEYLINLNDIKYFICHHQDPDITACLEDVFDEIGTTNKYIITHWRTKALLSHYNWKVNFLEVESNNFYLNLGSRELKFVFTPYMHFPGNICTYDVKTKTLFSSDIFGAYTEEFSLFAKNAHDYFEQMRPFLEHYMPSNDIVKYGIEQIEKLDINLIAPQHGSIIKREFIPYILERTKELEVGLFLHYGGFKKVQKLSKANNIISEISKIVFYEANIFKQMDVIYDNIREILPVRRILAIGIKNEPILFDSKYYRPSKMDTTIDDLKDFFTNIMEKNEFSVKNTSRIASYALNKTYRVYIFSAKDSAKRLIGYLLFAFDSGIELDEVDLTILNNVKTIFEAILNKELEWHSIEEEKSVLFEKSIKDELTQLYNRYYFNLEASKEFSRAVRYNYPLSLAFLDIDHFKKINDAYGHDIGDIVLKDFSKLISSHIRKSDIAFRYGGEEFIIIFPHTKSKDALKVIKRIKEYLEHRTLDVLGIKIKYTFSAGIVSKKEGKDLYALIKKADEKMYKAKRRGRNRIEV